MRWLLLQKTDSSRPWAGLPVQVPWKAHALFQAAVDTFVGDGTSTRFWIDRWLQGKTLAEWAPNLVSVIPAKIAKTRTVSQALSNRRWVEDIQGALTVQVITEYLLVWDLVDGIMLQPDIPDQHRWKLSSSGSYSCKSAYNSMFTGIIGFAPWKRVWKSWAPPNCRFFVWLAINNKCWTSDRLAKRGLPHQSACPFCDQAGETINHILSACVFSREVWTVVLTKLRLNAAPPIPSSRFCSWWKKAAVSIYKGLRKGFNSLVILVT